MRGLADIILQRFLNGHEPPMNTAHLLRFGAASTLSALRVATCRAIAKAFRDLKTSGFGTLRP
jgi:hypothetical protein